MVTKPIVDACWEVKRLSLVRASASHSAFEVPAECSSVEITGTGNLAPGILFLKVKDRSKISGSLLFGVSGTKVITERNERIFHPQQLDVSVADVKIWNSRGGGRSMDVGADTSLSKEVGLKYIDRNLKVFCVQRGRSFCFCEKR